MARQEMLKALERPTFNESKEKQPAEPKKQPAELKKQPAELKKQSAKLKKQSAKFQKPGETPDNDEKDQA